MGFVSYIIVGLICGTIAKAILSNRAVGGWITSLVIGVIGAIVGGWIGNAVFHVGLGTLTDIRTWVLAVVGSILVLLVYTGLSGKRSRG